MVRVKFFKKLIIFLNFDISTHFLVKNFPEILSPPRILPHILERNIINLRDCLIAIALLT